MKSRRILSAVLASLMLLTMLAACSDSRAGEGTATTAAPMVTAAPAETTAAETTEAAPTVDLSHIPADLKFNDDEIRFLDVNDAGPNGVYWDTIDIYAKDITGEVINDAVFKRNMAVEERLGVKITETKVADVAAEIEKAINAQNDIYDILLGNLTQVSKLTTKQYLMELSGGDIPYLDLSRSWWDQNQIEGMSINNKVYYATGDMLIIDNEATFSLIFNKDMVKDYSLENLYDLVNSGKWTFAKMHEMLLATTRDLNGDTKMTLENDQYGISASQISCEALFYAAGLTQVKKDNEDLPYVAMDVDKTSSMIEWAYKLCVNPENCFNWQTTSKETDDARDLFADKRALFYGETLQGVTRLRESDVNFGIIPYPKWDEAQERYLSFQHNTGSALAVPITNTKLEMTGAVLEMMAAKGQEYLTPAYYDIKLIGRGLRDAESEPMVEMILANRVYDLGYVYNWGGMISAIRTMVKDNRPTIAAQMKVYEKLFNNGIKTTLKAVGVE